VSVDTHFFVFTPLLLDYFIYSIMSIHFVVVIIIQGVIYTNSTNNVVLIMMYFLHLFD
jgi:hypothetical protein